VTTNTVAVLRAKWDAAASLLVAAAVRVKEAGLKVKAADIELREARVAHDAVWQAADEAMANYVDAQLKERQS